MKLLKFKIKEDFYAIGIDNVDQIIAYPSSVTPIPLAPKNVRGIINLRGQIVTILSTDLNIKGQNIIVMKKDQDLIGLEVELVDAIVEKSSYKQNSSFKFDVLSNDNEILVWVKDLKELFPDLSI